MRIVLCRTLLLAAWLVAMAFVIEHAQAQGLDDLGDTLVAPEEPEAEALGAYRGLPSECTLAVPPITDRMLCHAKLVEMNGHSKARRTAVTSPWLKAMGIGPDVRTFTPVLTPAPPPPTAPAPSD